MRTRLMLPVLMLVLALAAATALWAQSAPTTPGKAAHKQCAMHPQGTTGDCCQQGTVCGEDACCADGQCQECTQGCCVQTAKGMQCTMAGHAGQQGGKTHCQQAGGADNACALHPAK